MSHETMIDAVLAITNREGAVLGSCFCIPVLDSTQPGVFLLSTAHGLLAESRRGDRVLLVDHSGVRYEADIVLCADPNEPDIGLLCTSEPIGAVVTCTVSVLPGDVLIRGFLSGLDTRGATVRGWYSGLESLSDKRLMDVTLEHLGPLELPESAGQVRSSAYASLRGMSGAPVCGVVNDALTVCGMVTRRNTAGIANRVYALPIAEIEGFLGEHGYPLHVTHRREMPHQTGSLVSILIARQLDSPGGLYQLWNDASGRFYSGEPIDHEFRAMLQLPEQYHLETFQIAQLQFVLARLLAKRGNEHQALDLLRQARVVAGRSSSSDHQHLAALVDLRMMSFLARDLSPSARRSAFESSLGTYEQTNAASDDELAYEIASTVGSEAAQLAGSIDFINQDQSARSHFIALFDKHSRLLSGYPRLLHDKQEVVNIALSATELLWATDRARDPNEQGEALAGVAHRGKIAALQRNNGIFYTQMLLADAIAARASGDSYRAFALICLVGTILAAAGLRLSHEGVGSYLSYLEQHDPLLANTLRLTHSARLRVARTTLLNSEFTSPTERVALDAALGWCEQVVNDIRSVADVFALEPLVRDM